MKQTLLLALVVATVTACSKPEEVAPPAPAPQPSVGVSATSGSGPATTAATAPPVIDTSKMGPPPPADAIDLDAGGEKRLPNGEIAKDTLDYLNNLVAHYNEARATWSTDATPTFKSEQERQAYDDALKKMKEPITDLEALVKARLIKKVPTAPAGKKFVINPTTHKVELANQ
jgi:hypothetical protein